MLSSGLRYQLSGGPYDPPRTRRGRHLFCELRGTVKVGGYSDGPIPWPVKWGDAFTDSLRRFGTGGERGVSACSWPPLGCLPTCGSTLAAGFGSGDVQRGHTDAATSFSHGERHTGEDAANHEPGAKGIPQTQAQAVAAKDVGVYSPPDCHSRTHKSPAPLVETRGGPVAWD